MNRRIGLAVGAVALIGIGALVVVAGSVADEHGGRHGMQGMPMYHMMESYDADGDGKLTQAEIDGVREARLKQFDKDGDGTLTLGEYEALWLDAMREEMVDRFQEHDNDGDGKVTAAEFGRAHAKMVRHMDRNDDGVVDETDMMQMMMRHHGGGDTEDAEDDEP